MKFHILLFLMLLAGCAQLPQSPKPPARTVIAKPLAAKTPSVVVYQAPINFVWQPGGYTNFVVVTSTDLKTPIILWPTFLVTSQTNFSVYPTEAQRFYTLYGTNSDGNSAWVEK